MRYISPSTKSHDQLSHRSIMWWTLSLFLVCPVPCWAQVTVDTLKLKTPVRHEYRVQRSTERDTQKSGSISVRITVRVGDLGWSELGRRTIEGLVGTGQKYTSQWNTTYSVDEAFRLSIHCMRQIYLNWARNAVQMELGIIPPVKGKVSATSLDKDGWIRGGRLVMPVLSTGQLELVAGGLDRLEDPNAFQAWESVNYFEVEWTQMWNDSNGFEVGQVRLNDNDYTRGELRLRSSRYSVSHLRIVSGSLEKHDDSGQCLRCRGIGDVRLGCHRDRICICPGGVWSLGGLV